MITLTKVSAISEIISSVAIVVTLVYLTVETRQNTNALLAMTRQATMEADVAWIGTQIDDPELFGLADKPDLSPTEWARVQAYLVQFLRIREFAWFQYRNGTLDELTWESYLRPSLLVFASERARTYLFSGTYRGDPEFIEYLRNWFAEAEKANP